MKGQKVVGIVILPLTNTISSLSCGCGGFKEPYLPQFPSDIVLLLKVITERRHDKHIFRFSTVGLTLFEGIIFAKI